MITIERVEEGSCNGCHTRDIPMRNIFIGKTHEGTVRTTVGTQVTLCDKCFSELQEAVSKEYKL